MRVFLLTLLLLFAIDSFGQERNPNLIYTEFGGNSHALTLNYERIFPEMPKRSLERSEFKLEKSLRFGLGMMSGDLSIPLSLNLMKPLGAIGNRSGHNILLSGGPTIYTKDFQNFKFDQKSDESDTYLILNLGAGYRFTQPNRKFFIQGTVNPHIELDVTASSGTTSDGIQLNFGLAAGFRF